MARRWVPFVFLAGCIAGIFGCETHEELLKRINNIEAREKLYLTRIVTLEQQVEQQSLMIQRLTENVEEKETVDNKSDNIAIGEIRSDTSSVNEKHNIHDVKEIKTTPRNKRQKMVSGAVAFQAKVSVPNIEHIGQEQTIHFDTVLINEGDAFLTHSSIFVAPVPGLYVFSFSVNSLQNKEVQASIMKNSESIVRTYTRDPDTYAQGSVVSTISLEVGDEVYVRCDFPPDTGILGNGFTSFTGFLLLAF